MVAPGDFSEQKHEPEALWLSIIWGGGATVSVLFLHDRVLQILVNFSILKELVQPRNLTLQSCTIFLMQPYMNVLWHVTNWAMESCASEGLEVKDTDTNQHHHH